jgi:hypothetical protein
MAKGFSPNSTRNALMKVRPMIAKITIKASYLLTRVVLVIGSLFVEKMNLDAHGWVAGIMLRAIIMPMIREVNLSSIR